MLSTVCWLIAIWCFDFRWCGGPNPAVWWTGQQNRPQQFSSRPILLQLQWVCIAFSVTWQNNPNKLQHLDSNKKERMKIMKISQKLQFRYQQENDREGYIFVRGIRVGQWTQQTVEVCSWKGGTHLAVCHKPACCLWLLTHLFYPTAENRQRSTSRKPYCQKQLLKADHRLLACVGCFVAWLIFVPCQAIMYAYCAQR